MNEQMNRNLEKVEKYLRPLPAGERMDIVVEIKSGILELQAEGKSPEEIAARLGTPEELARGYLGEAIGKTTRFSFRRLCAVMAFYSLAGAAWLCRGMTAPLGWAILSGLFGLLFGTLCAPVYFITGGWAYGVTWWVNCIPFDIAHCIGNFVIALILFVPLRKVLEQLYRRMRGAKPLETKNGKD